MAGLAAVYKYRGNELYFYIPSEGNCIKHSGKQKENVEEHSGAVVQISRFAKIKLALAFELTS